MNTGKAVAVLFSKLEELTEPSPEEPAKGRIGFKANKERGIEARRR